MLTKRLLRFLRYVHTFMSTTMIGLIMFIILNTFVITFFRVDGHSMNTTLHDRQFLVVSIVSYTFHNPKKNDIIVLHYDGDTKIKFVKRVEGLPGDTVEVQGEAVILGPSQYFVEGDNRDHSTDSRTYGPIDLDQIIGKVILY